MFLLANCIICLMKRLIGLDAKIFLCYAVVWRIIPVSLQKISQVL